MAFTDIADLDCDTAVSLGGDDDKGNPNPTKMEGFYLGHKITQGKYGPSLLHIFQTPKGNVGVWGKTNLDQKLAVVTPGQLTRVTFTGMKPSKKGNDMFKFKVQVDAAQTIDVLTEPTEEADETRSAEDQQDYNDDDAADDSDLDSDEGEEQGEEPPVQRAKPPKAAAQAPSAEAQKRVQDRLKGAGRKSA